MIHLTLEKGEDNEKNLHARIISRKYSRPL